jgi:hypothetical protein
MAVPRQLLCLTMMGCMKPGLGESDLCDLMIKKHAQLISGLMEKYGIAEYTIVRTSSAISMPSNNNLTLKKTHNTLATKKLLTKLFDPGAVAFSEYDFVTQIMFSDVEMFLKIKNDPLYIELISQDHLNFSDAADEKRKTRYDPFILLLFSTEKCPMVNMKLGE